MFDRDLDCLTASVLPEAAGARLIHTVTAESLRATAAELGAEAWIQQTGFAAASGAVALLPGPDGVAAALLGVGASPGPDAYAPLATALPAGVWRFASAAASEEAVIGFCLGAYRFTGLQSGDAPRQPTLVADPRSLGAAQARAVWLARDLINTPANLLGPRELAEAAAAVCAGFGARTTIVAGEALAQGYPAIAAVGAASSRPPLVFRAEWAGAGADAPLISLVGKGVCFDSGGYDIKGPAGMLHMKKDMGGAAIMLGVARLIMERALPVRLELRIGCVENSISGAAMRPGDVIATRKGLSVEIGNTDAEGRLVLCDLLAEACEQAPAILLDAATLTGAARVALGPDLPALFCDNEALASSLLAAGRDAHDPLWRLPLHTQYESWLASPVADLNNVSSKPMAGAVIAALFLRRFVAQTVNWAHIDTYAWSDTSRPGRPEGGDAQGLRAVFKGLLPMIHV
ncbi:leucyl aminopeptidase family protein [Lichenicoccus sp.]|uniref:leucyl aminopeptidase family protein n=1 Tax=Lichenicoccus sp. TaxID=2781899 RepID=UPI003D096B08